MLNKIRTAILSLGLISTTVLSHPVLAKEAVGYCRLHTTAGWVGKGRCKVYTSMDNETHSIAVTIKEPWGEGDKNIFILLKNNPGCRKWNYRDKNCSGLFFNKESREFEELYGFSLGKGGFGYSFGPGYVVDYEGVFPQPSTDNYSGRD